VKHRTAGLARSRFWSRLPGLMALAASLALAACGGGGGGGGGSNKAPTASFTVTPPSGTAPFLVTVNGSASSDPDGTIRGYAWNFGDGSSGSGASTTHTYTAGGTFTITLTVMDNKGAIGSKSQALTVSSAPPPTSVSVSGKITYDRVPFKSSPGAGLDYGRITPIPARGIVVELIKADDQSLLFSTSTDASGNYSFGSAPVSTDVKVRAKAQTVSAAAPTWSIQVKNNTNSNALYVMDSASFNTGVVDQTKNLDADSGAAGFSSGSSTTAYSGPRVAAPFAILDSLYSAVQFVVTQGGDPSIALPALDVYWSPSNKAAAGNPAIGQISTTSFQPAATTTGFLRGIYVLGDDGNDTDEYDEHVLTHEFQHYLQDVTSRDDTVGGPHSLGEKLDLRVAFSEGYANAFSAMALNDPLYRDSSGARQGFDTHFNLESDRFGTAGWYNESTIGLLAWDLYDSAPDGADTVSLPYASIATVFRNQLRTGQPLTSIFPLIVALKAANPGSAAAIDTLVTSYGMLAQDAFGSTETNPAGNTEALPIYTDIALNGAAVHICGDQGSGGGLFNKLGNRRFLKFSLTSSVSATIHAQYSSVGSDVPGASTATPDPDLVLFKGGQLDIAEGDTPNQENLVRTLDAGDYVIEIYEYSHIQAPAKGLFSRGRTCFDVTITG